MSNKAHYAALGVTTEASPEEIRAAFRKLSARFHPDRNGGDTTMQTALNRAYEVLSDSAKRARYDKTGQDELEKPLQAMCEEFVMEALQQSMRAPNQPLPNIPGNSVDMIINAITFAAQREVECREILCTLKLRLAQLVDRRTHVRYTGVGNNPVVGACEAVEHGMQKEIDRLEGVLERVQGGLKILREEYEIIQSPITMLQGQSTTSFYGGIYLRSNAQEASDVVLGPDEDAEEPEVEDED